MPSGSSFRSGAPRPPRARPRDPRTTKRTRLFTALTKAVHCDVTVVSGPPGSGKTTLLQSWLNDARHDAAWITVRPNETDGKRFWRDIARQLRTVPSVRDPSDSEEGFEDSGPSGAIEEFAARLTSRDTPVFLVIDDLHHLAAPDALIDLEEFLTNKPKQLRVVLATRRTPSLGLHRLRIRGELAEIRGADLSFTVDETAQLLHDNGVAVSDHASRRLQWITEGWAAGLLLAARALAQEASPEQLVEGFTGTERTIAEYFCGELLDRLAPDARTLLVRTSILSRVHGDLAALLSGCESAEQALADLEQANSFVTALDVGRTWRRYHRLLADVLRAELRRTAPDDIDRLHRVAARWFHEHGYLVDAVAHAQAATDWAYAMQLLVEVSQRHTDTDAAAIRQLINAFPSHLISGDPEVARILCAIELRERGRIDDVAVHLSVATSLADAVAADRRHLFDTAILSESISTATRRGDYSSVHLLSAQLNDILTAAPQNHTTSQAGLVAAALAHTGAAHFWECSIEQARNDLEDGLVLARRHGNAAVELACLSSLALATASRRRSLELSREAVEVAARAGWEHDPIATFSHAGHAYVLAWTGRFHEAHRSLDQAERSHIPRAEPATDFLISLCRGMIESGQERLPEALKALSGAEQIGSALSPRHPLQASARRLRMLVEVRLGHVNSVRLALSTHPAMAMPQDLDAARASSTVLASVLLAEDDQRAAAAILAPFVSDVDEAPSGTTVHALLIAAMAESQLGHTDQAHSYIESALELAERDGIVFPFTQVPVSRLLQSHPRHNTTHAALIATIQEVISRTAPPAEDVLPGFTNKFGPAERRVLGYLSSNLSVAEIASELCVSVNTVKTHLRSIYGKLHANRRTQAVEIARKAGLLAPPGYLS